MSSLRKPSRARVEVLPRTGKSMAARSARAEKQPERIHAGTVIGKKYYVVGLIGRGGQSVVYEAMHTALGQRVALKFLAEERASERLSFVRPRIARERHALHRDGAPAGRVARRHDSTRGRHRPVARGEARLAGAVGARAVPRGAGRASGHQAGQRLRRAGAGHGAHREGARLRRREGLQRQDVDPHHDGSAPRDARVHVAGAATPAPISVLRPEIPEMLDVVVQRALAKKPEERFASADEMRRTLALAARTARLERKPIRRSRPDL